MDRRSTCTFLGTADAADAQSVSMPGWAPTASSHSAFSRHLAVGARMRAHWVGAPEAFLAPVWGDMPYCDRCKFSFVAFIILKYQCIEMLA